MDANIMFIIARFMGINALKLRLLCRGSAGFLDAAVSVFEGCDVPCKDAEATLKSAYVLDISNQKVINLLAKHPKYAKYCPTSLAHAIIRHGVCDIDTDEFQAIKRRVCRYRTLMMYHDNVMFTDTTTEQMRDLMLTEPDLIYGENWKEDAKKIIEQKTHRCDEEDLECKHAFVEHVQKTGEVEGYDHPVIPELEYVTLDATFYYHFVKFVGVKRSFSLMTTEIIDGSLLDLSVDDMLDFATYFDPPSSVTIINKYHKSLRNGELRNSFLCDNFSRIINVIDNIEVIRIYHKKTESITAEFTKKDPMSVFAYISCDYHYTSKSLVDTFIDNVDWQRFTKEFEWGRIRQTYIFESEKFMSIAKQKISRRWTLPFELHQLIYGENNHEPIEFFVNRVRREFLKKYDDSNISFPGHRHKYIGVSGYQIKNLYPLVASFASE